MGKYKNAVKEIKGYIPVFGGSMLFAGVIYSLLMVNQLVNSLDGLWEYSYHKAGAWELSLGRWFWLYLDRLRLGISVDPLTSIMTLILFSVGIILMLDLFGIKDSGKGYLVSFTFLSNVIVCVSLSYRFMSPTFGVAFVLSILSAWFMLRLNNRWLAIGLGAVTLAFSMGAYQAYVGCACMIILGYLLYLTLSGEKSAKEIIGIGGSCILSGGLGALLYLVILKIHLSFFHVAMSGYNGANTYTITNTFQSLFSSIKRTYEAFVLYFNGTVFLSNVFQEYKIYIVLLSIIVLVYVLSVIHLSKEKIAKIIILSILLLMIPIACGAILLVATDTNLSIQMTAGWGICIPVLLCVIFKLSKKGKLQKVLNIVSILLVLVIIYGNIQQVTLDQNAMLEGKNATITMANTIINRLSDEGCLSDELEYCVIGMPAGNPTFAVSRLYGEANSYAKLGVWWTEASCIRRSWGSVFQNFCGVNMNMASQDTYNSMLSCEEVTNMPAYPEEGFIYRKDNVVVIKITPY